MIFVSYSHYDAEWLKGFETIFIPLRQYAEVDLCGVEYEVRRIVDEQPDVYVGGKLQPDKKGAPSPQFTRVADVLRYQ
jgi:hypothetical protein